MRVLAHKHFFMLFFTFDIRFCTTLNTTRARRLCDIEIFPTGSTFQIKALVPNYRQILM